MSGGLITEFFMLGEDESNLTAKMADYDSRTCPCPEPTYYMPEFERNFRCSTAYEVIVTYKWVPFATVALYLVAIRVGLTFMKSRAKPFDLRSALGPWNVALAVFHILASLRMGVSLLELVREKGLQYALLHEGYPGCKGHCLWPALFLLSKFLELGDTAFLVLRGRKLSFLHVYHHSSVLLFTYHMAMKVTSGLAAQYMAINYFIHAFMYSYYACRTYGIHVSKQVAMAITTAQIAQMFYGVWVTVSAYQYTKHMGLSFELKLSVWIYASYAVLFVNFFVQKYFLESEWSEPATVPNRSGKEKKKTLDGEKIKSN